MIYLNNENFKSSIEESNKVLLYVTATWCGPCKTLSPTMDQIEEESKIDVVFYKLDADQSKKTCEDLGIRSIPALIFFKNGQLNGKLTGLKSKKEILDSIQTHLLD
jgi:thioredoxin 1